MNTNNTSTKSTGAQCCVDFCESTFAGSGGPVVNSYACNQSVFSSSAMWQIHRQRKPVVIELMPTAAGAIVKPQ